MRMTKVVLLTLVLGGVAAAACIPIEEAPKAIGDTTCVTGKVLKVAESRSGSFFLDFCENYRQCPFTVYVPAKNLRDVGDVRQLEGQVIEFTVGTDGHVSDVHGLEGIIDDNQVRQAAEQWMAQVTGPAIAPRGVALGQIWNSAQPATSMPLAGMSWRSTSTYLRNEPCRPAEPAASVSSGELCAVILTRQAILPGKQLRDPTPEDYRRNRLRTSGRWTGSGESLSYVSLQTHSAVSVTQDSAQQIDFTVTNSSGRSIRYAGAIETHSRVVLLPTDTSDSR